MMRKFFWPGFLILLAAIWPAFAGMSISPGASPHTHADANTGGSSLLPQSIIVDPNNSTGLGITIKNSSVVNSAAMLITAGDASNVSSAALRLGNNGLRRWGVRKNFDAESGANAGSNFEIESFDDSGNHLDYDFTCTRSTGNCSYAHSLGSTKACATGYTRISPNYCEANALIVVLNTTGTMPCSLSTALTGVTDAKAVQLLLAVGNFSTNSAGALDSTAIAVFPTANTTCTGTSDGGASSTVKEFNATASTQISGTQSEVKISSTATGQVRYTTTATSSASQVSGYVKGYYD